MYIYVFFAKGGKLESWAKFEFVSWDEVKREGKPNRISVKRAMSGPRHSTHEVGGQVNIFIVARFEDYARWG
jgi:hypothetical protein